MKKMKLILISMGLLLLLTSCEVNFNIKIYLRDLFEVWSGTEEVLYTYATMTLPTTSDENDMAKIKNRLMKDFPEAENFREMEIDYSDVLLFDFKVPICRINDSNKFPADNYEIVNIGLSRTEPDDLFVVDIMFDVDKLNSFNAFIYDLTWSSIDYEDITVECELNNDTRDEATVWTGSCFVNDMPSVLLVRE